MADSDITGLTELTAPAEGDWLVIDDTSDSGTTKKIGYGDVSGTQTVLRGDVMYIWPTSLGIYANIQAVFDAVPPGGTALLMSDLNLNTVNSNNPITITDPISVQGWGWGKDFDGFDGYIGTKISNAAGGTDCLIFDNGNPVDGSRRMDGMKISNLVFEHAGSGAAIEIQGCAWGTIEDVMINCVSTGAIGIDIPPPVGDINTFFIRGKRIHIRSFTSYGIRDHGSGTQNSWEDIQVVDDYSSVTTAGISLLGSDKRLLRGEYGGKNTADNTKTGIEVLPTGTPTYPFGTAFRVEDFVFEGDAIKYCIAIGGAVSDYKVADSFFKNNQCQSNRGQVLYRLGSCERNTFDGVINYAGTHGRNDLIVASFSALAKYNVFNISNPTMLGKESLIRFERIHFDNSEGGADNIVRLTTPASDMELYAMNAVLPTGLDLQVMSALNDRATQKVDGPMLRKDGKYQGVFFDPDSVTSANCLLWLDADTGLYSDAGTTACVDTDLVYQWDDVDVATRTSNNFIQATAGNRPTYVADVQGTGYPGVLFTADGSQEQLVGPAIALGGDSGTIVVVATVEGTGAQVARGICGRGAASSPIDYASITQTAVPPDTLNFSCRTTDDTPTSSLLNNSISANLVTSLHPDGIIQPTIVGVLRYDGSDGTATQKSWANGKTSTSNTISGNWNATTEAATWRVGTTSFGSWFGGWIFAVALFDAALSDQDVEDLAFYFMNKYQGINGVTV